MDRRYYSSIEDISVGTVNGTPINIRISEKKSQSSKSKLQHPHTLTKRLKLFHDVLGKTCPMHQGNHCHLHSRL